MAADLTIEDQRLIREAAVRLQRRYEGELNAETIERLIDDTTRELQGSQPRPELPTVVERVTNDRIRALLRLEASDSDSLNPSVLFLCVHNAGRSQMAAGWMRSISEGTVDVFSGGSAPASEVNGAAVAAMAEIGIDISGEFPQPWADEIVRAADVVVSMGCGDACPVYPGKRYVDWDLEDPAGQGIEAVRPIRDDIKERVEGLLGELTEQRTP